MPALLKALYEEHAIVAALLDMLEWESLKAERPDYALMRGIFDYLLTYPDQYHHPKEDLVYHRLCRGDADVSGAIEDLEAEHEVLSISTRECADAVDRLAAQASSDDPAAGPASALSGAPDWFRALLQEYLESYRTHMAKEEAGFFPLAKAHLSAQDWAELEAEVSDPNDPVLQAKARRDAEVESWIRAHRAAHVRAHAAGT